MKVETTVAGLRETLDALRSGGRTVGFVPTMGNLHAGHIHLLHTAAAQCDVVVASVFVNPTQFGVGEDFASYPRTLANDSTMLLNAGCHVLFAPDVAAMYPQPNISSVNVGGITDILCGQSRPGHFTGVATVVTKLLNMVAPTHAFFGCKDYQQLAVIQALVADLCLPVQLHGVPTVRAASGLALSSRNGYLSAQELVTAPMLYQTLQTLSQAMLNLSQSGWLPAAQTLIEQAIADLNASGFVVDYLKLYCQDLQQPEQASTNLVLLVAAKLGTTRLIDNLCFSRAGA